ncbi:MAG: DUF3305 domain-containing protein [Burkholderiaceae bacterium]|nr:DUF3305 domain-containing protein [Burkholderiaceae bacterium]
MDSTDGGSRQFIPVSDGIEVVDRIPVTVILRTEALAQNRWLAERRSVVAVLPADPAAPVDLGRQDLLDQVPGARLERFDGLEIELHPDECESYYFNLMVEAPRCFVVSRRLEDDAIEPFIVTPSFDLANAYTEGDDQVDSVALDPGLLIGIEAYVLTHFAPQERVKRRRKNWSGP